MKKSLLTTLAEPGHLQPRFQPIFRLNGRVNQVHSIEALVRGPAGTNFEQADILFDYVRRKHAEPLVDRICLSAICTAAASLPSNFRLNVNVHATTLGQNPEFAAFFEKETARHGLALHRFTVEIVEHSPTRNIPAMLHNIAALRESGVRIALDDVGLGQSNYRMMLDCHPDYFKLDAYFIQGLCVDPKRRAVVESVATLAEALGSSVIAEGAESLGDLGALEQLGVELVQANVLCPALPAEELLATGLLQSGLVEFGTAFVASADSAQSKVNEKSNGHSQPQKEGKEAPAKVLTLSAAQSI